MLATAAATPALARIARADDQNVLLPQDQLPSFLDPYSLLKP
jgi:hypothetical protein